MLSETPTTQPNNLLNPHRVFATLRDALADLYPTQQDANIIVHDVGLIAREITFSSRAKTNWHNILTAALQQQRLDALLEVVRKDYASNPALQTAYTAYQDLIEQGESLTSSAHLEDVDRGTVDSAIEDRISTALDDGYKVVKRQPQFTLALVNQKIEEDVSILRKCRFFAEFDKINYAFTLARKLVEGELSSGTDATRCQALAWCVRILAPTKELDKAEEYLRVAKTIATPSGGCPELGIANAFIVSSKDGKSAALRVLAAIDLPMARTAALMVVAQHEGSHSAITWLNAAGIEAVDLDADGKLFLLQQYLELSDWETALACLASVTDDDFQNAPFLYRTAAVIHLLMTVPNEFRTDVLTRPPSFDAAGFPLASDKAAVEARKLSHRYFTTAAQIAMQLDCPDAAAINNEYGLWLELREQESSANAKRRLADKLREPKTALRFLHLGLQFGIQLNLDAFEQEIERQIALNGGMTSDTAMARLTLAFTQKSPGDRANYLDRYYEQLSEYINKKFLCSAQIEWYSKAGLADKALDFLQLLKDEGLSEAEENRLRRRIAEAKGADSIEIRREQFRETNSLVDLISLVDELEDRNEWASLCEYGEMLFNRTRSLRDTARLVKSLTVTQSDEHLLEFLKQNETLVAQSNSLQMHYCWSLYHNGALLEARAELLKLRLDWDDPNYRALQINLNIALGNWSTLSTIVTNECNNKDHRSAHELMGTAQLALAAGMETLAKELILNAASKGSDNADVLAAAYFLASKAGWEDESLVYQWLERAAEISDDAGPIQRVSLKDMLDRKPEWDRHASETWQHLAEGKVPIFLAAPSLNRSLIDLMLLPALGNQLERDPRRRGIIPAYSGKRQLKSLNADIAIGVDITALVTLSFLNVLEKALDTFAVIYVPHSTLIWLFEEKQKVAFHQPSRIRDAHRVQHLLSTGVLEKLEPSSAPEYDLVAQVGEELAQLIAEAEKYNGKNHAQHLVVRSSPVRFASPWIEGEADLTAHAAVLSSCQAVVDTLRAKGQLLASEGKKAQAYLQVHEKPWPNQPIIADGATLYLDDLSVTYLLHLDVLHKLKRAGFRAVVSPRKVHDTNQLIAYENITDEVGDAIEQIRSTVSSRIVTGKIKVGRRLPTGEPMGLSVDQHPTFDSMALVKECDAIIVDDRFLNQHPTIEYGGQRKATVSTVELLDTLVTTDAITPEERLECRTRLRRAGYFFVPVDKDEMVYYLNAAEVRDGKLIETAELKAIRENLLQIRMSNWLQLPDEANWLDRLSMTFIVTLKALWISDSDFSHIRIRADWLLHQIDIRGWLHKLSHEEAEITIKTKWGTFITALLIPLTETPRVAKQEYWRWIEQRILAPVKEQYPEVYTWLIERLVILIAEVADSGELEEEQRHE